MKSTDWNQKLDQIKRLAKEARTGTPKQLADKLEVSERTARRFVERLKAENFPIEFSRSKKTYVIRQAHFTDNKSILFELPVPF